MNDIDLPMKAHFTLCPGCNQRVQIAGGKSAGGYRIPTHHHPDMKQAQAGKSCPGSNQTPTSLVP